MIPVATRPRPANGRGLAGRYFLVIVRCLVFVLGLGSGLAPVSMAWAVCSTTSTAHCLQGSRFRAQVSWQGFGSDGGTAGTVAGATSDSGLFYFFGSNNWEIMVKVLDACGSGGGRNNHFWVFAAAATNLQYTLTVTDTQTGVVKTYFNPLGAASSAITDTLAFATCGGPPVSSAQVRYLNNLVCNGVGFTSTLQANGFTWVSPSGQVSSYQNVNRTSLGPFLEQNNSVCPDATYPGTFSLASGRRYSLVQTVDGGTRILGIIDEGLALSADVLNEDPADVDSEPIYLDDIISVESPSKTGEMSDVGAIE